MQSVSYDRHKVPMFIPKQLETVYQEIYSCREDSKVQRHFFVKGFFLTSLITLELLHSVSLFHKITNYRPTSHWILTQKVCLRETMALLAINSKKKILHQMTSFISKLLETRINRRHLTFERWKIHCRCVMKKGTSTTNWTHAMRRNNRLIALIKFFYSKEGSKRMSCRWNVIIDN